MSVSRQIHARETSPAHSTLGKGRSASVARIHSRCVPQVRVLHPQRQASAEGGQGCEAYHGEQLYSLRSLRSSLILVKTLTLLAVCLGQIRGNKDKTRRVSELGRVMGDTGDWGDEALAPNNITLYMRENGSFDQKASLCRLPYRRQTTARAKLLLQALYRSRAMSRQVFVTDVLGLPPAPASCARATGVQHLCEIFGRREVEVLREGQN